MSQMVAMSRGMAAMNGSVAAELASAQSQITVLSTSVDGQAAELASAQSQITVLSTSVNVQANTIQAQAHLVAQAQSALIEQNSSTVAAIAAQNLSLRSDLNPAGAAAARAAFCAAWSPAITALSGSNESTCDL